MAIDVYDVAQDSVIRSAFGVGATTYGYALENLVPLTDRFEEQRKKQSAKFYQRLKEDIIAGCIMPPITIALVSREHSTLQNVADMRQYVNEQIERGYILDGLQRLNTLQSASSSEAFDITKKMYVNIIIAEKYDFLLYRMITLNNGQKPMTPRHQIEILTRNLLDFSDFSNISVQSEKDTEGTIVHGSFRLADISAAYTAFLTNNVNNDNNKIIDEKMNEILVGRVMDSDISNSKSEFSDVLGIVDKFSANKEAKRWLKVQNNLIGFSVGCKECLATLDTLSPDQFASLIAKFEESFSAINPSKVNVGKYRRELSHFFVSKVDEYLNKDVDDVTEDFVVKTTTD